MSQDPNPLLSTETMLMELIALAGQAGEQPAALELLMDDVLTRTALVSAHGVSWLEIVATLPKFDGPAPAYGVDAGPDTPARSVEDGFTTELAWPEEGGFYEIVTRIPAHWPRSQKAIMDAIISATNTAAAFHRRHGGSFHLC